MATKPLRLLTERDREILAAIDLVPLTVVQLRKLSATFSRPFTSERRLRERLRQLHEAGWLNRWPYATAGTGAPHYHKPTKLGFALLHGEDALPPTKRAFDPVGLLKQAHTLALADFLVHTLVAAHRLGCRVTNVHRENTLKIEAADEFLYPDGAFQIITPSGQAFNFLVEIDRSTERIRSTKDADSWDRKLRTYDRWQQHSKTRVRVLIVMINEGERLSHVLDTAARITANPERSLFYGIALGSYLAESKPLTSSCFRDHRGRIVPLVSNRGSGLA